MDDRLEEKVNQTLARLDDIRAQVVEAEDLGLPGLRALQDREAQTLQLCIDAQDAWKEATHRSAAPPHTIAVNLYRQEAQGFVAWLCTQGHAATTGAGPSKVDGESAVRFGNAATIFSNLWADYCSREVLPEDIIPPVGSVRAAVASQEAAIEAQVAAQVAALVASQEAAIEALRQTSERLERPDCRPPRGPAEVVGPEPSGGLERAIPWAILAVLAGLIFWSAWSIYLALPWQVTSGHSPGAVSELTRSITTACGPNLDHEDCLCLECHWAPERERR